MFCADFFSFLFSYSKALPTVNKDAINNHNKQKLLVFFPKSFFTTDNSKSQQESNKSQQNSNQQNKAGQENTNQQNAQNVSPDAQQESKPEEPFVFVRKRSFLRWLFSPLNCAIYLGIGITWFWLNQSEEVPFTRKLQNENSSLWKQTNFEFIEDIKTNTNIQSPKFSFHISSSKWRRSETKISNQKCDFIHLML